MCRCERLDEDQFVRFHQLVEDEEEVDVNCCTGEFRWTPLISLCCYNHSDGLFDCVHLLLQRPDIQINQTTGSGSNALMALCQWSKSDQILEVAQFLIANGIEINQTTGSGMNALMLMCYYSESGKILEVAQLLIVKVIDIIQKDEDGRNAEGLLAVNLKISQEKKGEILSLLQHCAKDPNERPSAKELLQHDKFQLDQQVC